MAIPDFQSLMLPLLQCYSDGEEHSNNDTVDQLAFHFKLTQEEANELLSSGKQTKFYNRIGWARTYLFKSQLIEMGKRHYYKITNRGKEALKSEPSRIDMQFLLQYPEYVEFRQAKKTRKEIISEPLAISEDRTPEEILEDAYFEIRSNLAQEVLENVMKCSPAFFERLVVELLVKMGYGGSWADAAKAVGQSGDGGIDGIIDEDRLGLESIYIQAKRWDLNNSVSQPELNKFVGALAGKKAKKGVFITTSKFSEGARKYVEAIEYKIVLIDGERLAELMIDHDIGVTEITSYRLKRIDSDYFSNI